jgi:hypothetical protein
VAEELDADLSSVRGGHAANNPARYANPFSGNLMQTTGGPIRGDGAACWTAAGRSVPTWSAQVEGGVLLGLSAAVEGQIKDWTRRRA